MSSQVGKLRNNLLNLLVVVISITLGALVFELTTRYVFDDGMKFRPRDVEICQ